MRSVIHRPTERCARCLLPPRWCLCAAEESIHCPLQIDVLLHQRELTRPSSTGRLITRLFAGSRQWLWQPDVHFDSSCLDLPQRELWVLHPSGEPVPAHSDAGTLQLLLLDGLWNETAVMARAVAPQGKLVRLPMQGTSRYWLRAKQDGDRFSTAEALLFLLDSLGLEQARQTLQRQFELHVYAGLRARGRSDLAAAFVEESVLPQAMPEALAALQRRRPLPR